MEHEEDSHCSTAGTGETGEYTASFPGIKRHEILLNDYVLFFMLPSVLCFTGVHVPAKHSPRRTVPIHSTPGYPAQPQPQYHTAASTRTITARQPPHRRASRPPARVVCE